MSYETRLLYSTDDVELDENRNVREISDIAKVAYQMLKVCKDRASPAQSEFSITSDQSLMYPSESESEEETSTSTTSEPQPSTLSTSESESSSLETETDMIIVRPTKAEEEKKITILRRPQIEHFRPICPPLQMPQTEEQLFWPIVQTQSPSPTEEVQPQSRSTTKIQPFRPILPQPSSHPQTEVRPIRPILQYPLLHPSTGLQPLRPMIPRWLLNKQKEIQLLQKIISQLRSQQQLQSPSSSTCQPAQKTQSEEELKNQIKYEGRNILNLAENMRPYAWQLQTALYRTENPYASDLIKGGVRVEGESSNTISPLVIRRGRK